MLLCNRIISRAFVLLQLVLMIQADCVCNQKGIDACQGCSGPTVVRPKQKYQEPGDLNLSPIGDNCWCGKLLIEPAALPKTCNKILKPALCSCSNPVEVLSYPSDGYASNTIYGNYNYVPRTGETPPVVNDSPPADPISVSLAIQAGKAIEVPEAKLAYGFVQKPIDGLQKVFFSNVPEENLFKLQNEVITLKKRPYAPSSPREEELPEEPDEDELVDDNAPPQLTYKQLGYRPEQFKNPKFRKVLPGYAYSAYDDEASAAYADPYASKVTVDCGFRPGRVMPYTTLKKFDAAKAYY